MRQNLLLKGRVDDGDGARRAMALGDGAVENDRLIVMVYIVIDTVRKIRSGSGAVKTLYDHYAFQESNLIRIICQPRLKQGA
jgi:hypothetical protein